MLAVTMELPLQISDFQLAFAKAYAESGDAVAAAKIVLDQLDDAKGTLKAAADAIRDFVLKGNPEAELPLDDDEEERLTATERTAMAALMEQTLNTRPEISTGEMIDVIETAGTKLRDRLKNPNAFIASSMNRRRRQLRDAAEAKATAAAAQVAQPQPTPAQPAVPATPATAAVA